MFRTQISMFSAQISMFRAQISSETEGLRGKMLNDETDLRNQNSALLEKLENEKLELEAKLKGEYLNRHKSSFTIRGGQENFKMAFCLLLQRLICLLHNIIKP